MFKPLLTGIVASLLAISAVQADDLASMSKSNQAITIWVAVTFAKNYCDMKADEILAQIEIGKRGIPYEQLVKNKNAMTLGIGVLNNWIATRDETCEVLWSRFGDEGSDIAELLSR